MSLDDFLSRKPLFYDVIDYERFPRAYASIASKLHLPKIIHLVGTNGKGSTGRFLATALRRSGVCVGHYTSPHILRFNERIWINGSDIDDETLEHAHCRLLDLLDESVANLLSYFEYTTLLAVIAFEECEYVVMEAGLGGEHDATAVFPKVLSIFTPIDFDHAAFLGTSIENIASTKLRSMQDTALLGKQPHSEVYAIAETIAQDKNVKLLRVEEIVEEVLRTKAGQIANKNGLSDYLCDNLLLAMAAFTVLGFETEDALFDQHALFGRLSPIAANITLDVGHNPLAAREIARAYAGKKAVLIYNTYADKDYREILGILKPIIERVEIIAVDEARIAPREDLEAALRELEIPFGSFESIDEHKMYLVFGSFSVAEAFIKFYTRLEQSPNGLH